MKKTVLTFAAIAFSMSVAFAQTTPETDQTTNTEEQSITIDRMSDQPAEAEAGRKTIKVEELPEAVQKSLASGEFQSWTIVSVAELQPQSRMENLSNTEVEAEAQVDDAAQADAGTQAETEAQVAAVLYEIEFVPAAAEQTEGVTEETMQAVEEGAETEAGAEIAVASPALVVVRFDNEGKILSRVDRAEAETTQE